MQTLDCTLLQEKRIRLQVLRLDQVHPVVSGNKIFKLRYFLDDIKNNTLITFGGAYSNHLAATAFACRQKNIQCVGVVRGEKPAMLSHTLQHCLAYGMQLHFISREAYEKKDDLSFIATLRNMYGDGTIVPEGGYGVNGAAGAADIMKYVPDDTTHICCAAGTATTAAGLLLQCKAHQQIVMFPVLKGMQDIIDRIDFLTGGNYKANQLSIQDDYHFGGYAKKTPALIQFMNELYSKHTLPTDFVYTAKMMFGVRDLVEKDFFLPGSRICCIHTGGLQGNLSLSKNTLTF